MAGQFESGRRTRDTSYLAAVVLGVLGWVGSFSFSVTGTEGINPAQYPRIICTGLILFGLIGWWRSSGRTVARRLPGGRVAVVFLFIAAYVVLLPYVGFLVDSLAGVAGISWFLLGKAIKSGEGLRLLGMGWGMTLVLYAIFTHLLQINLPTGIW